MRLRFSEPARRAARRCKVNGAGTALVGLVAAAMGFYIAWLIGRRELQRRDRILDDANRAKSTVEAQLTQSRTEAAGLAVRLEERVARVAELEARVREQDNRLAASIEVRERLAQLTAEAEGLRAHLEQRQVELLTVREEQQCARREILELREKQATLNKQLEVERDASAEKLVLVQDAESQLRETFKALSADALRENNRSFLELAKTQMGEFQTGAVADLDQRNKAIDELVAPIRDSLLKVDSRIQEVERTRSEAYGALSNQLQSVAETQRQLHNETSNLVRALRAPSVRGRWGEIQLRRVVELAGMAEHCDFTEQPVADSADGRVRPDLVVHLPTEKQVIVDSKVPLEAYLKALEAPDDATRTALLREHARQVRDHMVKLASKSYWAQFENTPDHVVMFIPGEVFFFAALQHDPELIEYGVSRNVFVAGPTTLISLLRTVAYGWRQERIAENAEAISRNGRELYDRIATLADHLRRLGAALDRGVEAYNDMVGSMESRLLVGARRFKELGAASGHDLEKPRHIERGIREPQALELRPT